MVKSILPFIFTLIGLSITVHAQNFQVGHVSYTVIDSSRNRSIPIEIYYPADATGDNLPMTATSGTFPVLSFGHGFVMTWDSYQNIWQAVVPQGYIMIFPKTETGFSPSHLEFGKDLAFCIEQMQHYNSDTASLFYNRVDSSSCVMGHSMGGGASFLSVPFNSRITALAAFAPAETNPSAISAAVSIGIPSLIIAGESDCVAPPATNQILMYNALASSCKSLVTIVGGTHCQMANSNVLCNFGEATCLPANTISAAAQHATIERVLIPWLNYSMKNDCQSGIAFDSLLTSDTSLIVMNSCNRCDSLNKITDESLKFLEITPNPFTDHFEISSPTISECKIVIRNSEGRIMNYQRKDENDRVEIETNHFSQGVYFVTIIFGKKSSCYKVIKLS